MSEGNGEGVLVTQESWKDKTGKELLTENTEYHFIATGSITHDRQDNYFNIMPPISFDA